MENKSLSPTPKEAVAAVTFLRDEVRKGKLTMAPLLRKKLLEIGLFRERAFQKLIEEGRRAFRARTMAADQEYRHDVDTLVTYEATNADFRNKVKTYIDAVGDARSEDEAYDRIDALRAFLAEFGFMSREFLKNALGPALFQKYVSRVRPEPVDETEEQEAQ